jgi:sugar (pentulose or hexulose) kinase
LKPPLYLGIDFGTSACRAIAIDAAGQVWGEARAALPPALNGEQAPDCWWEALVEALRRLWLQVDASAVRAIAVDGTSATLLLADADGKPLTPALLYHDSRAQAEARRIAAIAPAASPARGATGSLAKLLYLRRLQPRACHALHQADWIAGRLLGSYGRSDENNCLKLGYDPQSRAWPQWLRQLDVPASLLPHVSPPGTAWGTLCPAAELGLPASVLVVAGTTDSTAAFLATGASQPGEAVTVLGSTLVLKILTQQPINGPAYGIYSHRLGNVWLTGGASNSGGAALLQFFDLARLQAMTPLLRPDHPTGLEYYPLPRPGERFPIADPALQPRLTPRPADDVEFFQGMLEGMARIEQQGYARLRELGAPPLHSVRSTGGGAANPAWTRIRQRLLQVPLLPALHTEAAYGSALLARQAGLFAMA